MLYSTSILAMAATASAHMVLNYPKPFPTNGNSPLDPSGSDFPCRPASFDQEATSVQAGEKISVSFKGGATHGGGSCQFSLTPGTTPSKDSQWKVIHSVIGGCLTKGEGNLGSDATAVVADSVDVTIPSDLPDGDYTFSWSWLNRVGNREFYQSCAPLSVSGGSGSDVSSALGGLPDMFVANMPPEQCSTTEGVNFAFPNPGSSVDTYGDSASTLTGSGCEAEEAMGAGNGELGSSSGDNSVTPSNPGGVFAPSASSAADQPTATASSAPEPSTTSVTEQPSTGNGTSCSTEGAIVCIGSSQFGICNGGSAVAQDLAPGTSCSDGSITRRSARRFPRGHLARRHGSAMF